MPATATAEQVREAYRRQARRHHPDRTGGQPPSPQSAATMASVNEAYRILGDPARRSAYDAARPPPTPSVTPPVWSPASSARRSSTVDSTPARYPWKLVIGMAVAGITFVIVAAAFNDPSPPPPPDNVLQAGSCVAIEPNGDAREVTCAGDVSDMRVHALVNQTADCDAGTTPYRDRQGMGIACVEPAASPSDLGSRAYRFGGVDSPNPWGMGQ